MCIVVGIWLAVETIIGFLLSLFFLCILIDWLSAQGNLSGDVWIVWNGCWWIEGLGRKWGLRTGMDDPHVLGWGCFPFLSLFHGHWSFVSPITNYYWWDWYSLLATQCLCHPWPLVPLLPSSRLEPLWNRPWAWSHGCSQASGHGCPAVPLRHLLYLCKWLA